MIRRPPRSTLFPYTTLFRSSAEAETCSALIGLSGMSPVVYRGARRERKSSLQGELDGCGMRERPSRSEEHTSELQSRQYLVCRLLLEKNKMIENQTDGKHSR